jgi:hypothetical protein
MASVHVPEGHVTEMHAKMDMDSDKYMYSYNHDRLCDPVARVPSYRSRDPGFESRATRFSGKYWVCNGVPSAS